MERRPLKSPRRRVLLGAGLVLGGLVALAGWGGVASGKSGGGGLAAAQAVLADAFKPKTKWIGPTSSPPPVKGKTVGIIPCALFVEGCRREADGAKEAAKAIGWKSIVIDGKVDAQVQLQAMKSLISRKVDAIILNSVNATSVGEGMAAAKKAGIPVITSFAQDPDPFGGIDNVEVVDEDAGKAAASYIVTHGGGNVMAFDDNSAEEVIQRTSGLRAGLKQFGGAKIILHQNISGAKLGPPQEPLMTALLQRYPKGQVQWIWCGYDFMCTAFVRAIQRAGRDEIKAIAYDGNLENVAFMRKGETQIATVGFPIEWAGWAVIDDLNRYFNGEKLWPGTKYIQFRMLDKRNLPPAGKYYQGDLDFRAKFKQLWGVK